MKALRGGLEGKVEFNESIALIENEVKPFTKLHLKQLALEFCEWQETAILCNGRLRELARTLEPIVGTHHQCLAVAQSFLLRELAERAATAKELRV